MTPTVRLGLSVIEARFNDASSISASDTTSLRSSSCRHRGREAPPFVCKYGASGIRTPSTSLVQLVRLRGRASVANK